MLFGNLIHTYMCILIGTCWTHFTFMIISLCGIMNTIKQILWSVPMTRRWQTYLPYLVVAVSLLPTLVGSDLVLTPVWGAPAALRGQGSLARENWVCVCVCVCVCGTKYLLGKGMWSTEDFQFQSQLFNVSVCNIEKLGMGMEQGYLS